MSYDVPDGQRPGVDPSRLADLLQVFLVGGEPTLTGPEVAERAGVPFEVARERWRSLGFTSVPEDEVAFTDADLHAIELMEKIRSLGLIDSDDESALVRTVGRSFARLAEWQLTLLARGVDLETASLEDLESVMTEVAPAIEELMDYVWRRHTLSAATRMLLAPVGDEEGQPLAVGFADIVGYTRQSRSMHADDLARLVEEFESSALRIVTEFGGRIIKSIGDEVLFVADDPAAGAAIALELTERHRADADFPQLRVGLAHGPVLARLGDVYGPVVNLAARLTSIARPGRAVADRGLAEALGDDDRFRLRRMRRTTVKGYRRLEPWSLKRPMGADPEFEADSLPGPASQFIAERGRDLVRAVDEGQAGPERPPGGKGSEKRPGR